MASFLYTNPSSVSSTQQRVVLTTRQASHPQRGGRYIGGSTEPIVEVTARIKRASK